MHTGISKERMHGHQEATGTSSPPENVAQKVKENQSANRRHCDRGVFLRDLQACQEKEGCSMFISDR